jgi:hypothetical protein
MFRMKGAYLINERGKVMHVSSNADNENQYIYASKRTNHISQQWDVVYADKWKGEPKKGQMNTDYGMVVEKDFYIISRMAGKRYLDILGRNMVIKTKNGKNTQKWYFHQQSLTIRSRSNNQSWDIASSGRSSNMQVYSTSSKWWQIFRYRGHHFINVQNKKALDVTGNKDQEGNNVQVYRKHNGRNQRWRILYVDQSGATR